jgi:hypothetical protein
MKENPFKKIVGKIKTGVKIGGLATAISSAPLSAGAQTETAQINKDLDNISLAINQEKTATTVSAENIIDIGKSISQIPLYDFEDFYKKQHEEYVDSLNAYYKTGDINLKPIQSYKYIDASEYTIHYCSDCRSYTLSDSNGNVVADGYADPREALAQLKMTVSK